MTINGANLAAVVLLTCKMGIASEFMRRISSQFGTMVIGYSRRVAGQEQANGRARVFLEGDAPNFGTNVPPGRGLLPALARHGGDPEKLSAIPFKLSQIVPPAYR